MTREEQLMNEQCDELLARMKVRHEQQERHEGIITKDFYTGLEKRRAALFDVTYMDTDTQKAWDDWLGAHLRNWSDALVDGLCPAIREHVKKQVDDVSARIDAIETRLDEIETRLDTLENGNGKYQG